MNIKEKKIKLNQIIDQYNSLSPIHPIDKNIDLDGLIIQLWMRDINIDALAYGQPYDKEFIGWSSNSLEEDEICKICDDQCCGTNFDIRTNKLYLMFKYYTEIRSYLFYIFTKKYINDLSIYGYGSFWDMFDEICSNLGKQRIKSVNEFRRLIQSMNKLELIYVICFLMNCTNFDENKFIKRCLLLEQNIIDGIKIISNLIINNSANNIQKCWRRYWYEPYHDEKFNCKVSRHALYHYKIIFPER